MAQQKTIFWVAPLLLLLLWTSSCDPYYTITLTNETSDTVRVFTKENMHFHTPKEPEGTTSEGMDIYVLAPGELLLVGSSIAELDDDLPFETITIVNKDDTITANTPGTIKNLFDRQWDGLKTPYNITIK